MRGELVGSGDPDALHRLAEELRAEPVIGAHVRDPDEAPALGLLAAAGPRAAEAPAEYTLLFEAIREGYLVHYGDPRLLDEDDPDLNLLAGDYLYALGLERLAARGDMEAVRELGDLISLSAQLHARGAAADAPALWLAAAVAVGAGPNGSYETHKQALRDGDDGAAARLAEGAREQAATAGIGDALASAADSIGFASEHLPDRG
jgi:hypothetical protein